MNDYQPYSYYIKWTDAGVWYYGIEYSNTTKIANPKNLWSIYFTSSKNVLEYRKRFGEPDIIKVTKLFNNSEESIIWENKFLRKVDAKNNPKSLNGHNSDGLLYKNKIVSEETKLKLSEMRKKNIWWNDGTNNAFCPEAPDNSYAKGRILKNNPGAQKGAAKNKSKKWFNDGSKSIFVEPLNAPSGYSLGRIMGKHKNPDPMKKQRKWWNNKIKEVFDIVPPDNSYELGRIRSVTPT
jgi:hypothetical protein